jgi:hypothetical protein
MLLWLGTSKGNSKLDRLSNPLFGEKRNSLGFLTTIDLESDDLRISVKT